LVIHKGEIKKNQQKSTLALGEGGEVKLRKPPILVVN
jgi:hypothetical protein